MNLTAIRNGLILAGIVLALIVLCCSCKITKQIQKAKTETKTETKLDSASHVRNDIKKESETKTVITEQADTLAKVAGLKAKVKGDTTLSDGTRVDFTGDGVVINQPDKNIPFKINKRTETTTKVKETDNTETKTEVKKKEEKKSEVKTVDRDVKKTGVSPWWLLLVLVIVAGYIAWRFRSRLLPQSRL